MLFLWKKTKLGKIWLDSEEFRQTVSRRLPSGYYCQEVSFIGDRDLLNIYISVPESEPEHEKAKVAEKFRQLFEKSGIRTSVNWIHIAPHDNPETTPIWTLPLFWSGVVGLVTALIRMGISGILWTLLAAVIGYGIAWLVLTEDGQKKITALIRRFRR